MGCLATIGVFLLILAFTTNPILGFALLIIFSVIGWLWYKNEQEKLAIQSRIDADQERFIAENTKTKMRDLNFNLSHKYVDVRHTNKNKFLAIDQSAKKIALVDNGVWRTFDFKDILESIIIEDGQDLTTTSRSSQVGRALVGAVLAGGVGAIIGGAGATQEHKTEVNSITLKIVVNDIKNPSFPIEFLTENTATKGSDSYKFAMNNATRCHDTISVIIRQTDEIDNKVSPKLSSDANPLKNEVSSIANELEKLFSLKEKGVLSQEEFEIQKGKLLKA